MDYLPSPLDLPAVKGSAADDAEVVSASGPSPAGAKQAAAACRRQPTQFWQAKARLPPSAAAASQGTHSAERRWPLWRRCAQEMTREASDAVPFSGLAFKIMTDPFVGSLTFVRVYSGVLEVRLMRGRQP